MRTFVLCAKGRVSLSGREPRPVRVREAALGRPALSKAGDKPRSLTEKGHRLNASGPGPRSQPMP